MMLQLLLPDKLVDRVGGAADDELEFDDEKARSQYSIRSTMDPTRAKCIVDPEPGSDHVEIQVCTRSDPNEAFWFLAYPFGTSLKLVRSLYSLKCLPYTFFILSITNSLLQF